MRSFFIAAAILLTLLLSAQGAGDESVEVLIKKLGSTNFQERQAATKALQQRPEAAGALRAALASTDREIARRSSEILELWLVPDIKAAAKDGRIDRFIEIMAAWPEGKYEKEAWSAIRELATGLNDLHEKNGGMKSNRLARWDEKPPIVICAKRITENTKGDLFYGYFFLRAKQIDVDYKRSRGENPLNTFYSSHAVLIAADSVRMFSENGNRCPIFAGGNVELYGDGGACFIVSGGDVQIDSPVSNALVIARGNVTVAGPISDSRIVSGKSVIRKRTPNSIITENEPNPLGFIRWADAPTEKAKPKAK